MALITLTDKKFIELFKIYLTAISARSAMYAYFNLAPNTVLLANSTQPNSKENRLEGDRFMHFAVGDLGVHIVRFKQDDLWHKFYDKLNIQQLPGVVTILLDVLFKFLSKVKNLDDVEFVIDNMKVYGRNAGSNTPIKECVLVGCVEETFHIAREVVRWFDEINHICSDEHKAKHPHICGDYPRQVQFKGRLYKFEVDFSQFKHPDGTRVFNHVHNIAYIVALDGLSSVSLSSFLKKMTCDYSLRYYLWSNHGTHVQMITEYVDDMVEVKSFRPHILTIPLPEYVKLA